MRPHKTRLVVTLIVVVCAATVAIRLGVVGYRCALADAQLIASVRRSDEGEVENLLLRGADANSADNPLPPAHTWFHSLINLVARMRGRARSAPTALQIAVDRQVVKYTDRRIVRLLIQHGADVNRRDRHGDTPLVAMFFPVIENASYGPPHSDLSPDQVCALMLVDAGCDVNAQNKNGITALMYADYGPLVRRLIERGAKTEVTGNSALGFAAFDDNREKTEILISHGATIDSPDHSGYTPLMTAACQGHLAIVSMLVSHGADVNHKSIDGQTPLIAAASEGQFGVIRFLLDRRANADEVDTDGRSPLAWAARGGYVRCVRLLLSRGDPASLKAIATHALRVVEHGSAHYSEIVSLLRAHGAA